MVCIFIIDGIIQQFYHVGFVMYFNSVLNNAQLSYSEYWKLLASYFFLEK